MRKPKSSEDAPAVAPEITELEQVIAEQAAEIVAEVRPESPVDDAPVAQADAPRRRGRRRKVQPVAETQPVADPPAPGSLTAEQVKAIQSMPVGSMMAGILDPMFRLMIAEDCPGLTKEEIASLDASGQVLLATYGESLAKWAPLVMFTLQVGASVAARMPLRKKKAVKSDKPVTE